MYLCFFFFLKPQNYSDPKVQRFISTVVKVNTCAVTSSPFDVSSDSSSGMMIGMTGSSTTQTSKAFITSTTYYYPNSEDKEGNLDGQASTGSQNGRTTGTVVKHVTESITDQPENYFEISKYAEKTTYISTLPSSIEVSTEAQFHLLNADNKEKLVTQATIYDNKNDVEVTTPTWEETFEELLRDMTVKKKPVYRTREAENSATIGSISILFLVAIVLGIVLLDISTIKNHWKMFQNNTKDFCSKCRKERQGKPNDVLELVIISDE